MKYVCSWAPEIKDEETHSVDMLIKQYGLSFVDKIIACDASEGGEFEIDSLLGRRGEGEAMSVLVRWFGYNLPCFDTWENVSILGDKKDEILAAFDE